MEETLIKRVMPNSLEAEQSVIGSMIMDQDAIVTAMEILLQEDFYHKQYGILFDAMIELYSSGQPVDLVFLIAAPNTEDNVHLEVLSRLSMLLMDESFKQNLLKAKTVEEFLAVVDRAENAKNEAEEEKAVNVPDSGYRVLAVTACPTGIAHTYMAAESLENTAKELGYTIKVETNGSGGDKNVLTAEELSLIHI